MNKDMTVKCLSDPHELAEVYQLSLFNIRIALTNFVGLFSSVFRICHFNFFTFTFKELSLKKKKRNKKKLLNTERGEEKKKKIIDPSARRRLLTGRIKNQFPDKKKKKVHTSLNRGKKRKRQANEGGCYCLR